MRQYLPTALLMILSLLAGQCLAMPKVSMKDVEAPPILVPPILLYPENQSMQANDKEQWSEVNIEVIPGKTITEHMIRNVTNPALYAYLPDPSLATGTAVIVAPGGAFMSLAIESEGLNVVKALNKKGIAAFLLKYTLNPTPREIGAFQAAIGKVFSQKITEENPPNVFEPQAPKDALKALSIVKQRAKEWHIDVNKIGFIGFSAGSMTVLKASIAETGNRPAFFAYIYGPMFAIDVPDNAPPMFAAYALDDGLFGKSGFGIVSNWRAKNIPVEVHAYEKGEHGFGLGRPGTTSIYMIEQFSAWLALHGM